MLKLEDRIRKYEPLFGQWYLGKKIERLGNGNSGTVFAIHKDQYDSAHKRVIATLNYALKVVPIPKNEETLNELRRKCRSEEEVKRRLLAEKELAQKEIDIMERLWSAKSNNIVFFENNHIREREDTYGWDVLICMERLERLDKLLENYKAYKLGKPGYDLYMRIWSELLDGLRACEGQNIVHLDIKPENIFYGPPGLNRFKLGDFGVSAKTEADGLAEVGMRVGTIEYMAPEVHKGAGGDTRSDMYSLALVIYQLLNNNRLPFQSMGVVTREDSMRASQIRIEGNTPIPRINGVDPATMDLLLRCLDPDPRNRFQTVSECKQALMQVVGSKRKHGKLMPILIGAAAVAVAGLAALGITLFGGGDNVKQSSYVPSVVSLPAGEVPGEVTGMQMSLRQNFMITNGVASVKNPKYMYSGSGLLEGDVVSVVLNGEKIDEFTVPKGDIWTYEVKRDQLKEGICEFRFVSDFGSVSAQPFIYDKSISTPVIWNGLAEGSSIVNGYAEPCSLVGLSGSTAESVKNGKIATCIADSDGWFAMDVSGMGLREGEKVRLQCSDLAGNMSPATENVVQPAAAYRSIVITDATIAGRVGEKIRIVGTAEPRSKLMVGMGTSAEVLPVDVHPDGSFAVDITVNEAAAVGDIVTFKYTESAAADCWLKIAVDNSCKPMVCHIPASNDPVIGIVAEPGARCSVSVDGAPGIEQVASGDGLAYIDLSAFSITGVSQLTVTVTDVHGNQGTCTVQAHVSSAVPVDINKDSGLDMPVTTDTVEETEAEEASEAAEESVAQAPQAQTGLAALTQNLLANASTAAPEASAEAASVNEEDPAEEIIITAEPTAEPTQEPTPEPTPSRQAIGLDYTYSSIKSIPEGCVPGRFNVLIKGMPNEQAVISVSCSFSMDQEQREIAIDESGNAEFALEYASEGRVTIRARYADQEPMEETELSVMIDGKAPQLFVGEVFEGEQTITGTSEAGAEIRLLGYGAELSTIADANGTFSLPLNYYAAGVDYTVSATDSCGNAAEISFRPEKVMLVYDAARDVPVTNIKQGNYTKGSSMITITVSGTGKADREIAVFVNGVHQISVDSDSKGEWSATLMMPADSAEYDIKAMYAD